MKKIHTILSTCLLLSLFTSCASISTSTKTSTIYKPEFIEDVVISGGSASGKTVSKKQIYSNEKTITESNIETAASRMNLLTETNRGKNKNELLYNFIDNWYGVPYRFGGTGRAGIDCSAFVQELYLNVYGTRLLRTSREQFSTSNYINNVSELKEGDLVFFKIRTKSISHVGVYLSDGKFVHASRSKGVVISNLADAYWSRYYVGGGRVIG